MLPGLRSDRQSRIGDRKISQTLLRVTRPGNLLPPPCSCGNRLPIPSPRRDLLSPRSRSFHPTGYFVRTTAPIEARPFRHVPCPTPVRRVASNCHRPRRKRSPPELPRTRLDAITSRARAGQERKSSTAKPPSWQTDCGLRSTSIFEAGSMEHLSQGGRAA